MPVPAGITMINYAYGAAPKVATVPTIANGVLTWPLVNYLKSGRKQKITIKLTADACTTPAALALDGTFTYTDISGAKTVHACLKKPLYVTDSTCIPAPKPGKPAGVGGAAGGKTAAGACTCSLCEVRRLLADNHLCTP